MDAAPEMKVEEVTEVSTELVEAFARLTPQLSRSSPPPGEQELERIVQSDATRLLVAKVEGVIVGSLTLALFWIPTGLRAWIEDVVVDEGVRGQGIGAALTETLWRHTEAHTHTHRHTHTLKDIHTLRGRKPQTH